MSAAYLRGGDNWEKYFGWGVDRNIAASIYDISTVTARAAGNWKKVPDFEPWPRPWQAKEDKPEKSLMDAFAFFASGGAKVLG
jgi:hypothetical protein